MEDLRVGPFVRAVNVDGVAIWTEWNCACEVTLTAISADHVQRQEPCMFSVRSYTVKVGGRYYALSLLTGLRPATWYSYQVSNSVQEIATSVPTEEKSVQCFRTLDLPDTKNALRLAYGSCRKLSTMKPDALSAFGAWLIGSIEQRESVWPHLLLLIGDQIYADDELEKRKQIPPPLDQPILKPQHVTTQSFEDFARKYMEAWESDEGIRQVFAVLPTYMIFDDHEISNGWNTSSTWRANALQQGFERTLVDGLVAYWIYQGWGNIGMHSPHDDALLSIMQQAADSGQDALESLRARVRQAVYQEQALKWHYTIPTTPPLFVADVRSDRPAILDGTDPATVAPRIMSEEQMVELRGWMREHASVTTLLVSSVPVILPPLIGFAEYVTGVRPFLYASSSLLRRLGRLLAGVQQKTALRRSFDHWPAFGATWQELVALLASRKQDVVILSGDVHFSYAIKARRTLFPIKKHPILYQLVASPFRNELEQQDKRLIVGQSWIKRGIYGGLYTALLPLRYTKETKYVSRDMLFQNVVALVTLSPQKKHAGHYAVQQVYLSVEHKVLKEVGSINYNM